MFNQKIFYFLFSENQTFSDEENIFKLNFDRQTKSFVFFWEFHWLEFTLKHFKNLLDLYLFLNLENEMFIVKLYKTKSQSCVTEKCENSDFRSKINFSRLCQKA